MVALQNVYKRIIKTPSNYYRLTISQKRMLSESSKKSISNPNEILISSITLVLLPL
jgi:hypothetical protein